MKNKLSGEYWSGKRWLVYDILKSAGWPNRLRFFTDYSEAAAWCKAASGKNGVFRIRVLAEMLAGLNGVWQRPFTPEEKRSLAGQLLRLPVSSFTKAIPLEVGLRRHRYFPVLWNSELNALTAVNSWQVISHRLEGGGKSRAQLLGSFPDFGKSMVAFMKALRRQPLFAGELLLAGQLDEAAGGETPDLPPEEDTILFYRFGRAGTAEALEVEPEIEQINDPMQPLLLQSPYFASFNRPHGVIHLYDGGLRMVRAGSDRFPMDLAFFDFDGEAILDRQAVL